MNLKEELYKALQQFYPGSDAQWDYDEAHQRLVANTPLRRTEAGLIQTIQYCPNEKKEWNRFQRAYKQGPSDQQLHHYETLLYNFQYVFGFKRNDLQSKIYGNGAIVFDMYSYQTDGYMKVWLRPWLPKGAERIQYYLDKITYGGRSVHPDDKQLQWQQILNNFNSLSDGNVLRKRGLLDGKDESLDTGE